MVLYRTLLHLLPRHLRERHGEEMAAVFADLTQARRLESGRAGVAALWLAEVAGLIRFSLRRRAVAFRPLIQRVTGVFDGGPPIGTELRWAWRAVRTRGVRGLLVVALLAVAMAANAIVFAAADSFVFNRAPYLQADRLVEIGQPRIYGWQPAVPPELVAVWRKQTDLFLDFQAYFGGGQAYLDGGDDPRYVTVSAVTPGLFGMLGARPLYGRTLTSEDASRGAEAVAIVAEEVAAEEFGDAREAIGRTLALNDRTAKIVGVMPTMFRFPTGLERIWTPLDLSTVQFHSSVQPIGRLAQGLTIDAASRAVTARGPALAAGANLPAPVAGQPPTHEEAHPISPAVVDPELRRLFGLLVVAGGCLLLVACANVVNLELGAAVARLRTFAVSIALGSSRATLVRTVLLEGAILVAAAGAIAVLLVWTITTFIATHLPVAITNTLTNPIAVHPRVLVFMVAIAAMTWLLATLPVAIAASRADVLDVIKVDSRTLSTSRTGVRVRYLLTAGEVALTVMLLLGAALSARSYIHFLNLPTGFDAEHVATLNVRQGPHSPETNRSLQEHVLLALRARPDVAAAAVSESNPPTMGTSISGPLSIGVELQPREMVELDSVPGGPDYFKAMALPILAGRTFQPGDPLEDVIVDEHFAQKYWPGGSALGATFHVGHAGFGTKTVMTILGVAAHLRTDRDTRPTTAMPAFATYLQQTPQDNYQPVAFVLRMPGDSMPIESVHAMVRALAPGARVRIDRMSDRYADTFANERLASSIMGTFGILAFAVAAVGVYGVMAFLVATRTREIGIRMALGADRTAVRKLILQSSVPPVLGGVLAGIGGAVLSLHWTRWLFAGVETASPTLFILVGTLVLAAAAAATWQPAKQAGRIDPSQLLRD